MFRDIPGVFEAGVGVENPILVDIRVRVMED